MTFEYPFVNCKFPTTTGVYSIGFKNSKKVYIGSASKIRSKFNSGLGFRSRWRDHLSEFRNNKNSKHLQSAYNLYGEENLIFKVIESVVPERCVIREQHYIDFFNSYKEGYNLTPIAGSSLGRIVTQESKNRKLITEKLKRDMYKSDVLKLYNEFKSVRKVSNSLNIGRTVINTILKDVGIDPTIKFLPQRKTVYVFDDFKNLIGSYNSTKECLTRYKMSPMTFNKLIKNGQLSKYQTFFSYSASL
jgi:group I intron endonuclease